ncbi:hypothetical protein PspLS_03346 [Pyricularia sp. CBS 133598]|nr:hypothetical protein PspLS_03346 [Pyricularia sp. CBS 133598]
MSTTPIMKPAANTSTISPEIIEAIRGKKKLYCRAVDSKSWGKFDLIALADATLVYKSVAHGPRYDRRRTGRCQATINLVNGGSFKRMGDDEVEAVFGVITHGGPASGSSGGHITAGGYYYEVWKNVGREWFLKSIEFDKVYNKKG